MIYADELDRQIAFTEAMVWRAAEQDMRVPWFVPSFFSESALDEIPDREKPQMASPSWVWNSKRRDWDWLHITL